MRIDAFQKVSQVYQSNKTTATNKQNKASFSDQLEISQVGKDLQVAKQAVENSDDIRLDKIEEIKARMEAGSYHVSMKEVADKLVDSFYDNIL